MKGRWTYEGSDGHRDLLVGGGAVRGSGGGGGGPWRPPSRIEAWPTRLYDGDGDVDEVITEKGPAKVEVSGRYHLSLESYQNYSER